MADNLIFPIKFDLEAAVREAQGDADRLLRRLQTTINAKPLAVNLKIPGAGSGSINEINSRLKELVKQWNNLTEAQRITNKTTGEYTAEAKKILAEYTRLRGASESYAQSLKQIDSAAKKAAKQQEKLAEAAYRGSNAFKNQDGYVSRLIKRLAVYASFQYTSQFLTNIREVTAQFELQRISLGAIIQDQQKANQIFAEIKSFALTSPLKILDLTKYAKQVAAYGFAADRVFDVTKRLADISVGLGVDMGRLTLAVSQIKAATALKASELRQLTETGLPMLDLLSKKLTETQGKLVSAADVMDLISKRAISYEMVEEILYDLTDAGGMFYNMQVKQSQTLFGMWSKLGDAAAIMYDQIGNTSSINAGMKLAIQSIESMMRNWKTTARVLDSVAVAMTVYIVGLKNAAVASKALTSAVALENLAHQQQIIRTPKVVAGIIGINNAKKISTLLTNLHTKAVLSEAAATNVLTKGFWKLTAAMLANPWVAAASAIALVGVALFHFIGNTETAAERAEKLNNSVASLKNLDDTTKPLIDTYNELINKTERTAEEQKKLSEVTHELAKQYPGAITAIGNFGAEVELAADKLNQLYQVEKQARMDNTRHELEKTEQKITETEEKIARLQAQLQDGTKTVTVGSSITGYTQTITVQMSDEDKGKILKQIDELRYGEDGQSGLFGLQQSAEAARRALGLLPSEAAQAVEKFGAWKKTFTTFRQQVGNVRVQLFDDSTINQFGSLEEALKKTAEEYKKNIALVATYDETLKSATLTSEERAKIETERAEADAMANLAEKALKYYNAMSLLNTSTSSRSGTKSDPRLQNLKEEISLTKKLYDEYHKLEKQIGATQAKSKIQEYYANTIADLEKRAKDKYGFTFALPFTDENLKANIRQYISAMEELQKEVDKKGRPKFPTIGKEIDEAKAMLGAIDTDSLSKRIEKQLKELADKISRTKTAKEFYEKILGMTGDVELAANLTVSVYGQNGQDLQDAIREQIRTAFETNPETGVTIDLSEAINPDTGAINYNKLAELEEKYKDVLIDGRADLRKKLIDEGRKTSEAQVQQWLKDIEKAKDFAQQRIDLATYTANQIAAINARTDLPQADKDKLIKGYQDREVKQLAKLQYDEFKDSAMYVHIFEDLDHASTTALKNMRDRLIALKGQWKNLDPTQVKELTRAIADLDEQIAGRSPFKSILDGFKGLADARPQNVIDAEMIAATDELAKREKALAAATKKLTEAQTAQVNAQAEVTQARRDLEDALAVSGGKETAEVKAAREVLGIKIATFNAVKAASKDSISAAKKEVDKAADKYEEQKKVIDKLVEEGKLREANIKKIELANQKIDEYQQQINEALDGIRKMMEAFGASDEDMQFFDDVVGSLNEIVDAGQQAAMSVASFMSGNILGGITSGVSAIGGLVSGFTNLFSAGKVRRANKEIKRQQKILDRLQYTYSNLEKAAEKAFGLDYIANYNQQIKNLEAQRKAYLKQAQAERSKGKDKDEDKIREYENAARDAADEIAEMQSKLTERMTGTDVASAARDFASAWVEARLSFNSTAGAIKEKYKELIRSFAIEGVMARAIQQMLQPLYDTMDSMLAEGDIYGAMEYVADNMERFIGEADRGLEILWQKIGQRTEDLNSLLKETSQTGTARDIATASEESINGLAAGVTTQNHYMSYLPPMSQDLATIRTLLEARTGALVQVSTDNSYSDLISLQNQAMAHYAAIEANTAATVKALVGIASTLDKVVRPKAAPGAYGVVTQIAG